MARNCERGSHETSGTAGVLPNVAAEHCRQTFAAKRGRERADHDFDFRTPRSRSDSLNDLPPGKFLGRYQITRLIGRGGMGCVYEAVHRDLGKRVAIKTLLPSLAASEEARGRFLREGQAASRIRHPHVVDVTDVVAEGPVSYLVMEYLEGEDLSSLIERQGALPVAEAADVLLPVIAAIAAAHELGVIHRDLKPENIFLARTSFGGPCPKVVDFGISKVLGEPTAIALTATSAVFGTMYYLPPEQLGGSREADARGDQYALGTILYECVTGHRAFEGTSIYGVLKSVAEGVYPPARSWRPDLPLRLETAIDRAMRLNPAARFASVRMLGAELLPHASPAVRAVWTPVFGTRRAPTMSKRRTTSRRRCAWAPARCCCARPTEPRRFRRGEIRSAWAWAWAIRTSTSTAISATWRCGRRDRGWRVGR